jgi:hypothetical protein
LTRARFASFWLELRAARRCEAIASQAWCHPVVLEIIQM